MGDAPATETVACGKCTACCRGELLILHPDLGDDPSIYETQAVAHPFTGRPALALKKNFMGDCIYLSRATGCTNYKNRPVMCRKFSCVGLLRATGEAALRQYAHTGVISNDVIEAAKARMTTPITGDQKQ